MTRYRHRSTAFIDPSRRSHCPLHGTPYSFKILPGGRKFYTGGCRQCQENTVEDLREFRQERRWR